MNLILTGKFLYVILLPEILRHSFFQSSSTDDQWYTYFHLSRSAETSQYTGSKSEPSNLIYTLLCTCCYGLFLFFPMWKLFLFYIKAVHFMISEMNQYETEWSTTKINTDYLQKKKNMLLVYKTWMESLNNNEQQQKWLKK